MNDMTFTSASGQLDMFYAILDTQIAAQARAAAERIRGRMALAAESIVEIGRELIEQKAALGHGNFLKWIEAEFDMSRQTADNLVHVANKFGDKMLIVGTLAPTALYALAAPSTPDDVRDVVEILTADGEVFNAADIRAIVAERDRIKSELSEADRSRLDALDEAKKTREQVQKKIQKAINKALKDASKSDAEMKAAQERRIAELTAEITSIQNSPMMQALRDSVEEAARGTKNGAPKANRNPVYKPNPALDKTLMLIGPVRALAEQIPQMDPKQIIAGFIDANDREYGLSAVRICRDFLTTLLEISTDV